MVPRVGADGAVVLYREPSVVRRRPRLEQGHEVQVADAEIVEVIGALGHSGEGAREPVGVGGVPDDVGSLEPVRRE